MRFIIIALSAFSAVGLLFSIAQAADTPPFAGLRRETYRVASGFLPTTGPILAWDGQDSLTLAPGARLWRLRSFEADGVAYALCVDVGTLRTFVVREEGDESRVTNPGGGNGDEGIPEVCRLGEEGARATSHGPALSEVEGSRVTDSVGEAPYGRALMRYARAPMMGGGEKGLVVTVDLCPSRRSWDRDLFDALREIRSGERPMPVAVCVSGAWIRGHPGDMAQLLAWRRAKELDLTFVNHSDTHPVGERGDFLNNRAVDFEKEVLDAEVALLTHGAVPSAFFRFPGLVHSTARLGALAGYGLIPVDADHWPGRDHVSGDRAPEGILLLHGNGNQRTGVVWFFEMVRRTGLAELLREGGVRALSLAEVAGAGGP